MHIYFPDWSPTSWQEHPRLLRVPFVSLERMGPSLVQHFAALTAHSEVANGTLLTMFVLIGSLYRLYFTSGAVSSASCTLCIAGSFSTASGGLQRRNESKSGMLHIFYFECLSWVHFTFEFIHVNRDRVSARFRTQRLNVMNH